MSQIRVDTLKKAAFLHDLGKILNWSRELHLLDGARVLKHLGFDDTVVGVALYHEPGQVDFGELIDGRADCAGLKPPEGYDEYALALSELVDKLMAGFDRIGKEKRHRPVVLRNPLTHLPMDGTLRQFKDAVNRQDCSGTDESYMREFVHASYLSEASLKPLDAQPDDCVYVLDDELKRTELLTPLMEHAASQDDFNALYRILRNHSAWQSLTRWQIPQGPHPPTDTLALWYHMQFSSAMTGLYWAEGFRSITEVDADLNRLREKGSLQEREPLQVKIGLLYVHLAGLTDYFASAYRLPDFSGTQKIADALKQAVKQRLLDAKHNGEPFIWEDSFLYRGHDDFLVMVPTAVQGATEGEYIFDVDAADPFKKALGQALKPSEVIKHAVRDLLSAHKLRTMLACASDDPLAFDDGQRLHRALSNLVSVHWAERCFAEFKDGSELTPLFGVVWNRLRAQGRGRLPRPRTGVRYYAGDICDGCRANLAGHDPDPADSRDWTEVDWDRAIVRDEYWPPVGPNRHHLRYWIFRSESPGPGEGDKLCHACLLRRMLGTGTSLEEISPEESDGEDGRSRIAVIKGNVNRTLSYVGGSLTSKGPVSNEQSVYSRVWCEEIARPIFERSKGGHAPLDEALRRLEVQARRATPRQSGAKQIEIERPVDLSSIGLPVETPLGAVDRFLSRTATGNPFGDLVLENQRFDPRDGTWKPKGGDVEAYYKASSDSDWLTQAKDVLSSQRLAESWLEGLWDEYPNNPWAPSPLSPHQLESLVPWLFSGTPYFTGDSEDLPTPSRTMTVSWMIDRAIREVRDLVRQGVGDVVYADGDEFLIVCRAEEAPQLVRRIFRRVVATLNSVSEAQLEPLSDFLPVTLSVGMVVAKRKHPMYGLLELVDRLVRSAKKAHPNDSAIDFENVVGGVDDIYLDRQRFTKEWLSERPLTLSHFCSLIDDVESLRAVGFPATQLHQIAALMADVRSPRANRQTAALAYAWQPHDGEEWEVVRDLCAGGRFQDLMTLWRWPRREEESENAGTDR